MITYQHAKFIAQAIESVLMQETDFTFELLIGEDRSPDGTRRIAEEYQRRYPDRVRVLARERNLGAARNFVGTYAACHGQYVALLEGDDYWTDPKKLQRQVDALDAHPDWVICFHPVRFFQDDGTTPAYQSPESWPAVSSLDDLLRWNFIATCSLMFRNGVVREFPDWYFALTLGDWPLTIMLARHGQVGYLDQVMAAYRMHAGGLWTGQDELFRIERVTETLGAVRPVLDAERAARITDRVVWDYMRLAGRHMEAGNVAKARSTLWGLLRRESVVRRGFPYRLALRTLLQIEAPAVLRVLSGVRRSLR